MDRRRQSLATIKSIIYNAVYKPFRRTTRFASKSSRGGFNELTFLDAEDEDKIIAKLYQKKHDSDFDTLSFIEYSEFLDHLVNLFPTTVAFLDTIRGTRPGTTEKVVVINCERNNSFKNKLNVRSFLTHLNQIQARDGDSNNLKWFFFFDAEKTLQVYIALTYLSQLYLAKCFMLEKHDTNYSYDDVDTAYMNRKIDVLCSDSETPASTAPEQIYIKRITNLFYDAELDGYDGYSIDDTQVFALLDRVSRMDTYCRIFVPGEMGVSDEPLLQQIIVSPDLSSPFPYWRTVRDFIPLTNPPRLSPSAHDEPSPAAVVVVDPELRRAYEEKRALAERGSVLPSDLVALGNELRAQEAAAGVPTITRPVIQKPLFGGLRRQQLTFAKYQDKIRASRAGSRRPRRSGSRRPRRSGSRRPRRSGSRRL
jgi:hypothetical protein